MVFLILLGVIDEACFIFVVSIIGKEEGDCYGRDVMIQSRVELN